MSCVQEPRWSTSVCETLPLLQRQAPPGGDDVLRGSEPIAASGPAGQVQGGPNPVSSWRPSHFITLTMCEILFFTWETQLHQEARWQNKWQWQEICEILFFLPERLSYIKGLDDRKNDNGKKYMNFFFLSERLNYIKRLDNRKNDNGKSNQQKWEWVFRGEGGGLIERLYRKVSRRETMSTIQKTQNSF